jgi:hypothetical protein
MNHKYPNQSRLNFNNKVNKFMHFKNKAQQAKISLTNFLNLVNIYFNYDNSRKLRKFSIDSNINIYISINVLYINGISQWEAVKDNKNNTNKQ